MNEELKPCPFCGRNPISNEDGFVKCSYGGCGFEESLFYKNWNTRPLEDALQKRIAELEAELKITDELLKEATETIGPTGDKMSEESKPCPFCGELPIIFPGAFGSDTYRCANVDCANGSYFTAASWNTRHGEDALQKSIDELKEYEQACFVARQKDEKLWVKALMALQEQPKLQKRIDELESQLAQVAKENDWMKYPEPPESGAK